MAVTRGQDDIPQSAHSDADTRAALDRAVETFRHAWATGDWKPFTSMFADEFIFEFPIGPNFGRHTGSAAREKMMNWRHMHEVQDRITEFNENLRLYDGNWVVASFRSVGQIQGKPYRGFETILMQVNDGKIVEYREYLGGLGQ
jgi:ketosteroid isomerase-like protein